MLKLIPNQGEKESERERRGVGVVIALHTIYNKLNQS